MTISFTSTAGGAPAKGNPDRFTGIKALISTGCLEEATAALEEMTAQSADPIVETLLGQLYHKSGEIEKAFNHYRQATELRPDSPDFLKNLADLYFVKEGRVDEAIQLYLTLFRKNPNDIDVLLSLGHITAAVEHPEEAQLFFQKALEIDPLNGLAREALTSLRNTTGNLASSLARLN